MISMNVADYVKIYHGILDSDLCEQTVEELKNISWNKHSFYNNTREQYLQHDTELSVSYDRTEHIDLIEARIKETVNKYINLKFMSWFDACNAVASIRWNKYDTGTEMKLHCDHIHDLFDGTIKGVPILSIIGALNDDYEGGEFVMWEKTSVKIPKGSIMIFPSNFLYPHQVKFITAGTRYTCVSWAC